MFPTITARVTFRDFKSCNSIPSSMFFIPRDYKVSQASRICFHGEDFYQVDSSFGTSCNVPVQGIALHANRTLS